MAITKLAQKKIKEKTRVLDRDYSVPCSKCHKKRGVSYYTLRDIKKGKTSGLCRSCAKTPEQRDAGRLRMLGNKKTLGFQHSEETKRVIGSFSRRSRPDIAGSNSHFWKGGITPMNAQIRASREYGVWRMSVFQRDRWMCVLCGHKAKGTSIHADHIKPFALFPDLRLAIDNGRTLCIPCHQKTETYGRKPDLVINQLLCR